MNRAKYPSRLDEWVVRFLTGELTEEEHLSLQEWRDSSVDNETLFQNLISEENAKREIGKMASWNSEEAWERVLQKAGRRKTFRRWLRYGVAAMAVLTLGIGSIGLMKTERGPEYTPSNALQHSGVRFSRSTGEVYSLDTLRELALENMLIEGDERQMVVRAQTQENAAEPEMNMIEVPAKAEYSLILADGTRVLLNAATNFRFPDNFSGQANREVYLNGEAYFEVVSDSIHPFIVHTDQTYVKVLGTSFNVMAYSDKELQQTTLVKGRVCMGEKQSGKESYLLPGKQASYHKSSGKMEVTDVDVSYYTAWKDGLFAFREQRLEEVMETLARWYGFTYFFQNSRARDYIYTGKVPRHKELNEVLQNFRLTEELDFKVNKHTVIIKTKN